ncbi:hypothetical protein QF035_010921 [Streptomyces umbrinus]|uniref:Uncharacterized protein n=1 Tax=Streptomyces umbrinus TaxID=67370 RepID=A0ABU0TET2_9ACTN|nr:hypothetical protein [Streptomyces umbrinus]MDQ1033339.1 hypothetical protein [Streptomyces umbrinus]
MLDWLQPQRIELFRLEDTALTNTVAVVALETPSKSDGMPVPVDAAAHVLSKLETSKNLIGAMAEAIPQPFEPLSSPAPETVITIDDVARQMLTAVPISPFVGDAPSVVEGICRLLRWD